MSVFRKLISLLIGYEPEKGSTKDHQLSDPTNDRAVMLENVKLILTKGIFLMTRSGPGFRTDLFLFNRQYVEIRLCRNEEALVRIVIISGDGPEMNNYLELIRIDELTFSSH